MTIYCKFGVLFSFSGMNSFFFLCLLIHFAQKFGGRWILQALGRAAIGGLAVTVFAIIASGAYAGRFGVF